MLLLVNVGLHANDGWSASFSQDLVKLTINMMIRVAGKLQTRTVRKH